MRLGLVRDAAFIVSLFYDQDGYSVSLVIVFLDLFLLCWSVRLFMLSAGMLGLLLALP